MTRFDPWKQSFQKKVTLTAFTCQNCGAPLIIIAPDTAECDYCGSIYLVSNLDDIIFEEKEEAWAEGMPYSPYFYQPSRSCQGCGRWRGSSTDCKGRCLYHNKTTWRDSTCEHFRRS